MLSGHRRLAEGKVPRSEDFSPEIRRMFNEISESMRECEGLNAEWVQSFTHSLTVQTEALREFACDPIFQEAVIWKNRQALETALQSVARERPESLRKSAAAQS